MDPSAHFDDDDDSCRDTDTGAGAMGMGMGAGSYRDRDGSLRYNLTGLDSPPNIDDPYSPAAAAMLGLIFSNSNHSNHSNHSNYSNQISNSNHSNQISNSNHSIHSGNNSSRGSGSGSGSGFIGRAYSTRPDRGFSVGSTAVTLTGNPPSLSPRQTAGGVNSPRQSAGYSVLSDRR
jgi:hypothetical protein